jgi:hypothetical protein
MHGPHVWLGCVVWAELVRRRGGSRGIGAPRQGQLRRSSRLRVMTLTAGFGAIGTERAQLIAFDSTRSAWQTAANRPELLTPWLVGCHLGELRQD